MAVYHGGHSAADIVGDTGVNYLHGFVTFSAYFLVTYYVDRQ